MAYIRKHKDKRRAEAQRHGHCATQVCDTEREAQDWALNKEAELDAMIKACAQDICQRQFGNPACETGR